MLEREVYIQSLGFRPRRPSFRTLSNCCLRAECPVRQVKYAEHLELEKNELQSLATSHYNSILPFCKHVQNNIGGGDQVVCGSALVDPR